MADTIPTDIEGRWIAWRKLWYTSILIHWSVGVLAILASALAATEIPAAKGFAVVSTVCVGLLAFVRPETRYYRFVRAWRILDVARVKYQNGLIDVKELIAALERGEAVIGELESADQTLPRK